MATKKERNQGKAKLHIAREDRKAAKRKLAEGIAEVQAYADANMNEEMQQAVAKEILRGTELGLPLGRE